MGASRFRTTRWSLVQSAASSSPERERALAELCELYWYPVYAFVRRRGQNAEDAEDATQGFFTALLARDDISRVDAERGRFRSFLLAGVKNYLANEWDRATADKRGGQHTILSWDAPWDGVAAEQRYLTEPADHQTPETLFERRFAIELLSTTLARLGEEFADKGRTAVFDLLSETLQGSPADFSYREAADQLAMTEGAVKVTVHRMRKRFGDLLREEIANTVDTDEAIQEELAWLHQAVRP